MLTPRKASHRNLIQLLIAIVFVIAARVFHNGTLIFVWLGVAIVIQAWWARVTHNNPEYEADESRSRR
jgi:hypothetical protein